jgi:hypothetical protein
VYLGETEAEDLERARREGQDTSGVVVFVIEPGRPDSCEVGGYK